VRRRKEVPCILGAAVLEARSFLTPDSLICATPAVRCVLLLDYCHHRRLCERGTRQFRRLLTRLQTEGLENGCSIPGRDKRFFCSVPRPYLLGDQPNLLSSGHRGLFTKVKILRPKLPSHVHTVLRLGMSGAVVQRHVFIETCCIPYIRVLL
jgi:hypothetical protein